MIKVYHQINERERDWIAVWKARGVSNREIARRLGRALSTIKRELKRNGLGNVYIANLAQRKAEARRTKANRRHPLKNPDVYAYVLSKLREGWSPELIAGRLREVEHPNDPHWRICHETIYNFIYKDGSYWEYLPRKQKKRKQLKGRKVHRSRIPQRVSIRQRPKVVNQREEFGHWEGDSVEGRRLDKDGIHTEVERVTNYYSAVKVNRINSFESLKAQQKIFGKLPPEARRSTTLDNGKENHLHYRLKELGMKTYFADPYSSWQRGCNEHHNGLLRRYLPKGTSFKKLTQQELDEIVWEINNRPRKRLGYNTPQEAFEHQLIKLGGSTSK